MFTGNPGTRIPGNDLLTE